MKLFQTVQKNLALLGFIRHYYGYRYYFNRHNLRTAIILVFNMISIFIFAIYSADAFYILTVSFSIFVSHVSTIFKMKKLFDHFDKYDKVCDESKLYFIEIIKFIVIHFLYKFSKTLRIGTKS